MPNPYEPPRAGHGLRSRRPLLVYTLRILGGLLMVPAISFASMAITLANDHYWHIMQPRRAIYDMEINGTPVSTEAMIANFTTMALFFIFASVGLFGFSIRMNRPKRLIMLKSTEQ